MSGRELMNVQADFVLFKAVMYLGSYVKIFFLAICALLATEVVETYIKWFITFHLTL